MPAFKIALYNLLLGGDRVFCGLGDAELYNGLRFDLDGFAGLRVASYASFAMRLHPTAQAGNNEDAVLLGFFTRSVGQLLQKRRCSFVGEFRFLGEMPNELCLCQACCHVFFLLERNQLNTDGAHLIPIRLWKTPYFTRVL